MPIRMRCPQCRKRLAFAVQTAGKKGRCPICNESFVVPIVVATHPITASLRKVLLASVVWDALTIVVAVVTAGDSMLVTLIANAVALGVVTSTVFGSDADSSWMHHSLDAPSGDAGKRDRTKRLDARRWFRFWRGAVLGEFIAGVVGLWLAAMVMDRRGLLVSPRSLTHQQVVGIVTWFGVWLVVVIVIGKLIGYVNMVVNDLSDTNECLYSTGGRA